MFINERASNSLQQKSSSLIINNKITSQIMFAGVIPKETKYERNKQQQK
jgi:hypothetical protein